MLGSESLQNPSPGKLHFFLTVQYDLGLMRYTRKIAEHVSIAAPTQCDVLIDFFAGVGGNVIQFALTERWSRIYAIEKSPSVLACAKRNADIYGVADRIAWIEGDCFEVVGEQIINAVDATRCVAFASPPWGGMVVPRGEMKALDADQVFSGPGYRTDKVFDLNRMEPYNLKVLAAGLYSCADCIAMYLPRTSNVQQLAAKQVFPSKAQVIHYCMEGASKVWNLAGVYEMPADVLQRPCVLILGSGEISHLRLV